MLKKANIVLIGFMGAGKSLISKQLANILKRELISTDNVIETREKSSISDLFKTKGEAAFRQLERSVIEEIHTKSNVIIDCGGGIVLNAENIKDLKKNGTLVYLCASPETVYKRLETETDRPLLQGKNPKDKIKELMETRSVLYAQADITIITDNKNKDQIVKEIMEHIK